MHAQRTTTLAKLVQAHMAARTGGMLAQRAVDGGGPPRLPYARAATLLANGPKARHATAEHVEQEARLSPVRIVTTPNEYRRRSDCGPRPRLVPNGEPQPPMHGIVACTLRW